MPVQERAATSKAIAIKLSLWNTHLITLCLGTSGLELQDLTFVLLGFALFFFSVLFHPPVLSCRDENVYPVQCHLGNGALELGNFFFFFLLFMYFCNAC